MTAAELALARAVHRRVASMTPDLASAVLRAFARLRDSMTDAELARAIQLGGADRVVAELLQQAVMDVAFQPVRERTRYGVAQAARITARSIPVPPGVDRTLTFAFDFLNPRVIDAIRTLETSVITRLQDDTKETVRAAVTAGLKAGKNPRAVAVQLKGMIGLGPTQMQEVENFRAALEGRDGRSPFDYLKRDKRFDATIRKALSPDGEGLSSEQVDRMVDAYRKRRLAQSAETTARTAALQSQKLGQRLAYEDAIDKGIVDRDRLRKKWIGVMDDRERPEHVAMQGEVVPFDDPFSNGEVVPGSSTYNCRCLARMFLAPAA